MDTALLNRVARSFALSIRVLPGSMRDEVALAYLWARASDTLADDPQLPPGEALARIAEMEQWLRGEGPPGLPARLAGLAASAAHPGERALLESAPQWMSETRRLDQGAQDRLLRVATIIFSGQSLDLKRFRIGSRKILDTRDEVFDYAWRVAGCVGEYWTDTIAARKPAALAAPREKLRELGRQYGIGLQLVNILRDAPEDLEQGRCYLPGDGPSRLPASLEELHGRMLDWVPACREALQSGVEYLSHVRVRRLRLATGLPAALALPTLDRLARSTPQSWAARIKIPRSVVRRAALRLILGLGP